MLTHAHGSRDRFRGHALDGAMLYFHPRSGTNVRLAGPATRALRPAAPRVVMFGITNDCNLTCGFCSRDQRRDSRWTVPSAFAVLRDLSDAGTLEVAFGGGEPFAFPEFPALISRLHQQTPLALNVTTNGTLLDDASWAPYAGRFGQVRVSIYGDAVWRRCARLFAATGQRWGANLLVDDRACDSLPDTLADLAAAGCHDVSLLGYVGQPARLLSPRGRQRLADIALASTLPCRISVCFGSSLAVPRLLAGFGDDGDCGAGSDFLTITPDQRVQACSFQDGGFPGATAREILDVWRLRRAALAQPSPRAGCARLQADVPAPTALPPIAIWQAFSGNNSGECVLVAKFQTVGDAQTYLDELLPGWQTPLDEQGAFSPAWTALFTREQVAGASLAKDMREAPDALVQVGNSVLGLGYGAGDNFPELRALAWKRGALVLPGGIHVHDGPALFGAIATRDQRDRDALVRAVEAAGLQPLVHGPIVFLHVTAGDVNDNQHQLVAETNALRVLAAGRPVAAELLCDEWTPADLTAALQRLGEDRPERQRLWITFPSYNDGPAEARRFAGMLSDQTLVLGSRWLLIDPVLGRKRVAVMAYRRDADVDALDAHEVNVRGYFWRPKPPPQKGKKAKEVPMPDVAEVEQVLRRQGQLLRSITVQGPQGYNNGLSAELLTPEPGWVLTAMEAAASELDLTLAPSVSDPEPIRAMLLRLRAGLTGG